ncbi:hypothetical protein D3C76_1753980 [compost metagenome]
MLDDYSYPILCIAKNLQNSSCIRTDDLYKSSSFCFRDDLYALHAQCKGLDDCPRERFTQQ